ncbi:MAG: acyl-CoA dehydrogenase family protein [Acidimicrobiales bacterium]
MYVGDSPAQSQVRAEARAWLQSNPPPEVDPAAGQVARLAAARTWQRVLHDNGWAGLSWPRELGGRAWTSVEVAIFQQEETKVLDWHTLKRPFNVALNLAAPALMEFGTADQRNAHLPAILRGDEFWCQLFSEPGAGSDLAALSTRAVRDGNQFVVTGQKVWTSYAHYADYGLLLARTNPDVSKHKGISYFVIDMKTPGITVRPLRQMSGATEFNEVFFDDVVVPASCLIGEQDNGWTVAHATLASERQYLGAMVFTERKYPTLHAAAQRSRTTHDPIVRQRLAACYTREQILRYLGFRVQTSIGRQQPVGAIGSVLKLAQARHVVITAEDAMSLTAPAALGADTIDIDAFTIRTEFLASPGMRIGGGTDNIQMQAVAERILGLPRERSDGRDVAWRDLQRLQQRPVDRNENG